MDCTLFKSDTLLYSVVNMKKHVTSSLEIHWKLISGQGEGRTHFPRLGQDFLSDRTLINS